MSDDKFRCAPEVNSRHSPCWCCRCCCWTWGTILIWPLARGTAAAERPIFRRASRVIEGFLRRAVVPVMVLGVQAEFHSSFWRFSCFFLLLCGVPRRTVAKLRFNFRFVRKCSKIKVAFSNWLKVAEVEVSYEKGIWNKWDFGLIW